jgi:hypothetical protein
MKNLMSVAIGPERDIVPKWFRAREDTPGVPYRPHIKTVEWRNVTGRGDDRFAIGSLGLPIVFKKEGPAVHADHLGRAGVPGFH